MFRWRLKGPGMTETSPDPPSPGHARRDEGALRARERLADRLTGLGPAVFLLGCVPLWFVTGPFQSGQVNGPGAAFYPRILIVLLAGSMIVRLVANLRERRRGPAPKDGEGEAVPEEGAELDNSLISPRHVAIIMAFAIAYVLATIYLGWILATFLMVLSFLVLAGKRNLFVVVPVALILSLGCAYVFVKLVYLSLPTGVGVFDVLTVRILQLMGAY